MIYFTADQHFGHENIIKYCNRPFSSAEEMDEEMIWRWNEQVSPEDVVYHLGDFTLSGLRIAKGYFSKLHGLINVLSNSWHHDKRWIQTAPMVSDCRSFTGFSINVLPPMAVLEPQGKHPAIVLCHYPLARWDRDHYGSWHLHGHSHEQYQAPGLIYDVGVDNNDFYPVSLDQIVEIMKRKERILAR